MPTPPLTPTPIPCANAGGTIISIEAAIAGRLITGRRDPRGSSRRARRASRAEPTIDDGRIDRAEVGFVADVAAAVLERRVVRRGSRFGAVPYRPPRTRRPSAIMTPPRRDRCPGCRSRRCGGRIRRTAGRACRSAGPGCAGRCRTPSSAVVERAHQRRRRRRWRRWSLARVRVEAAGLHPEHARADPVRPSRRRRSAAPGQARCSDRPPSAGRSPPAPRDRAWRTPPARCAFTNARCGWSTGRCDAMRVGAVARVLRVRASVRAGERIAARARNGGHADRARHAACAACRAW